MSVGPGARATAAGLDAEEIVQERHHEVVMQVAFAVADHERDDGEALGIEIAQDLDAGVL
jgi:hypothetical protein